MSTERSTEAASVGAGPSDQHGSVWDSVSREISLGGAALAGVGHAFVDLKDHPGTALLELGSAAVIAGGLTLAGRGGPFLATGARIVETGLAVSFLKQLVGSGTKFGGAVYDAWNSPNNLAQDKQTVGSVAGQFAVDMTAFAAGGYAGSKLAGRFLSAPAALESPFRFSEDHTASLRERLPENPVSVKDDLGKLLGTDQLQQRFDPMTVSTKYGDAKIRPYYSKENGALNLTLDAPRFLTQPQMDVVIDGQGMPSRIVVSNDQTHFMSSMFQDLKLPALAEAAGRPTDFALADKFGKVNYQDVKAQMAEAKSLSGPVIDVTESYKGNDAIYVRQKIGQIAPISTALGTSYMGPCSALIVVDKASGLQYLAHVDHVSNPDLLAQSLKSFDLKNSDIYILEGPDNAAASGSTLLGSAQRAFMAVSQQPGAAERVKFLHYNGPSSAAHVVIKGGKIYAGALNYKGY